jgi:hypothetical protein
MAQLTGSGQAVALGDGYAIRAPGVRGSAELRRPRSGAERARSRTVEDGTAELDAALARTNVTEVRQIELALQAAAGGGAARSLRSTDDRQDLLEVTVPDLGAEVGQLVLCCDEAGVLTWHLPVDAGQQIQPPATRGSGGVKRFLIPASRPVPAAGAEGRQRSLIGVLGRKLLKVLVYPVTDPVVGAIGEFFAERWEERNRPYGVRDFSPGNFRDPSVAPFGPADLAPLAQGRALLFIHGTFSTAHGAFSQLPDAVLSELHARYGGRVFAFNHFTLSHDPRRNVEWLLGQMPPQALDVDIVCHSRGGLVARALAEHPPAFGFDVSRVRVGRIVFVGVPNAGTPLADPEHMVKMIDRLTTALNLFPSGPVAETLEAIITAIKVIGHGALRGLDGLASMRPDGAFLGSLNHGGAPAEGYFAIGADYEPTDQGLKALVTGSTLADAVLDRVFENTPNDLVVPEPGVFGENGNGAFPIAASHVLQVPAAQGVIHTTLFGHPPVGARLLDWLTPP